MIPESSTGMPGAPGSQADAARMELSAAAAASERTNRPVHLVYGAAALLVVALLYALVGFLSRASALADVENTRARTRTILAQTDEIRKAIETERGRGLDRDDLMVSKLEGLAQKAELKLVGTITDGEQPGGNIPGLIQKSYKVKCAGQDPGAILAFLKSTQESSEVRGLDIWLLTLKPGGPGAVLPGQPRAESGWTMEAEFVRWERRKK